MRKFKRASTQVDLMETAPRAIVHMRAQRERKRLGLIFGSGASKALGFPEWPELVYRIAKHPDVGAEDLVNLFGSNEPGEDKPKAITKSLASITQMLFSYFRRQQIRSKKLREPITYLQEQEIKSVWLRIVHSQLYKDVDLGKRKKQLDDHPYLMDFLQLIKSAPLTVNYNFDDTLEQLLLKNRSSDEIASTRGYEVTYRPNSQFQKDAGVIYHPNGFLPSTFEDGTSPDVIFSDDAFQDQLISAAAGKYIHLSNHLFRNTCLLIGLSLDDTTLQSMLRQNAVANPGNVHYIVHFTPREEGNDEKAMEAIFEANFNSYNLYTLFLDATGIKELAKLLTLNTVPFQLGFPNCRRKFVYYLVGSIGSGKSTATSNFRNLHTYDEWIDERLPLLARPENEIKEDSVVEDLDNWVVEQFRKKNFALVRVDEGIHLIDRCPLDPLTFGPREKRSSKASKLISRITDASVNLAPGHIIFLDCDLAELKVRNSFKHKYWPDEELQSLCQTMSEIYDELPKSTVHTDGRSAAEVAREIAKIIFLHEYAEVNVREHLERHSGVSNA